jgi:hypothetical protein
MMTQTYFRPVAILFLTVMLFGCSTNPTEPTTYDVPVNVGPGQFGFAAEGRVFERSQYPNDWHTVAHASLQHFMFNGQMQTMMQLYFIVSDAGGTYTHPRVVSFSIVMDHPHTGTFPLGQEVVSPMLSGFNQGEYQADTVIYTAMTNNGSITITNVDSVNNVISGTFDFFASTPSPTKLTLNIVHVSQGYFNNIPIDEGGFGQGTISALIDGAPFSTSSGGGFTSISANTPNGAFSLEVGANDGFPNRQRMISFGIWDTTLGLHDLKTTNGVTANYLTLNASNSSNIGSWGNLQSGIFTLTKIDAVNHRFSATFNFSGFDSTTHKTINVTNGVIDNVRWVVE